MDIDPVLIAVAGGIGVVAAGLAAVWLRQRDRLLSLPVLPVEQAQGHEGDAVVVGRATGEEITSPWTERSGVFFAAKEIVEERRNRGRSGPNGSGTSRRRQRRDLGEAGLPLSLAGNGADTLVSVEPDGGCDVEHLPKLRTSSDASGLQLSVGPVRLGGGERAWLEEHAAFPGDTLYVAGTVAQRAGGPVVTGNVALAAEDPAAQAQVLLARGGIAAAVAVAALGFAAFALLA